MRKGTLDDVKTRILVVNGKEIPFDECKLIAGCVSSEESLAGGIGLGMGSTAVLFGAAMVSSFSTPVAGVVVGVGIYFITKSKRFKFTKNWEGHSGELEYNLIN